MASGRCADYIREFDEHKRTVPDEPCEICGGAGSRLPPPEVGPGDEFCKGCDGLGQKPARIRNYQMTVEVVEGLIEFSARLRRVQD